MGTISNPPKFRGENGPGPVSVDDWNDFYKWLTGMWRATRDTSATVRPPADFPPSVGVPLQRDPLEGSIFPPPMTGIAPGGFPAAPLAFPGPQVSGLAASAREIESLLQASMARVPYPSPALSGSSANSWNDSSLVNGWANYGSGWANAGYRVGPDGLIELRGLIFGGTVANGTVLFTLPTGSLPAHNVNILAYGNTSLGTGWGPVALGISSSSGEVALYGATGKYYVEFDGLAF